MKENGTMNWLEQIHQMKDRDIRTIERHELLELCTPIACTGPSMRKDIGQAKLNLLKTLLA